MRHPVPAVTPGEALERLLDGNRRFVARQSVTSDSLAARVATPPVNVIAAILSCSEEPVHPARLFDQKPAELFLVTLAGNVVDHPMFGGLDYAVDSLSVPLVVVLGHTPCGVVLAAVDDVLRNAALDPADLPLPARLITRAIKDIAEPAADLPRLRRATAANVRSGVSRIARTARFEKLIQLGALRVVGAVLDGATGRVRLLE